MSVVVVVVAFVFRRHGEKKGRLGSVGSSFGLRTARFV